MITDEQIYAWALRHGLQGSVTDLRCAAEDAATLHPGDDPACAKPATQNYTNEQITHIADNCAVNGMEVVASMLRAWRHEREQAAKAKPIADAYIARDNDTPGCEFQPRAGLWNLPDGHHPLYAAARPRGAR